MTRFIILCKAKHLRQRLDAMHVVSDARQDMFASEPGYTPGLSFNPNPGGRHEVANRVPSLTAAGGPQSVVGRTPGGAA